MLDCVLAHLSPFKHAGRTLLLAVAGFGLATIVFGFSRSFWLSLAMLFLLGGFESSLTAQLFGPTLSVIGDGVGTILIVLLIALLSAEMRHLGTL